MRIKTETQMAESHVKVEAIASEPRIAGSQQRLGEGRKPFLLQSFQGELNLLTPVFWISDTHTFWRINCCYCKLLNLW